MTSSVLSMTWLLVTVTAIAWLAVTFALLWLSWSIGTHVLHRRRVHAQLRSLLAFAGGSGPVRTLDTPNVVALAADLGHPVILLSSELRRRLQPRQRRMVLAHEIAHLRRGDLTLSQLDDVVAARFGREDVAQTLIEVARMPTLSAGAALQANGGNTAQRIERLLDAPTAMRGPAIFIAGYTGAMLSSWVILVWAHHAIETLLGWIG